MNEGSLGFRRGHVLGSAAERSLALSRSPSVLKKLKKTVTIAIAGFVLIFAAVLLLPWRRAAGLEGSLDWSALALALALSGVGLLVTGIGLLLRHERQRDAVECDLREEVERLQSALGAIEGIMKRSLDVICTFDEEGRFVFASQAAARVWGYEPEELIGRKYLEFVHPEDHARTQEAANSIMSGQPTQNFENRYRRKDGWVVPIFWTALWSPHDQRMFCIAREMTEHHAAEAVQQRQAAEIEDLYNHAPCGYHSLDAEGRFVRINDTELRWLGYTREEVVGKMRFADFVTSAGQELFRREFPAFKERGSVTLEFEMKRRDGGIFPVLLSATVVRDAAGRYVTSRSTVFDITERRKAEEQLRASEERFRALLEATAQVIWTTDAKGEVVRPLAAWAQFTGLAPEETLGHGWLRAVHPEDAPVLEAQWMRCLRQGEKFQLEYRVRRHDGEFRILRDHGVPVRNADGTIREWVGGCVDITEQRKAEEALQRMNEELERRVRERTQQLSEAYERLQREIEEHQQDHEARAQLAAVVESSVDFIGMAAPDERPLYLNRAGRRLLNLGDDEDISKLPLEQIHPPEFLVKLRNEAFPKAVREGIWTGETVLLKRDGRRIPGWQTIHAHKNAEGDLLHFSTVIRDLTKEREADAKIREQARLLDEARDAIMVRDLEDTILFWNKGAERIFGWTAQDVIGRSAVGLLFEQSALDVDQARRTLLEKGEWSAEVSALSKSGRKLIVEARWTLLRDECGRPRGKLAIVSDITEKKKMETQFLRAQRLESIGTLASGVAHDLNNVLAPILMSLDLLKLQFPDEQSQRMIETIRASAQRGAELIKQVLSFARGAEGERKPVQLHYLISDQVKVCKNTFPRSLQIRAEVSKDLWVVLGDPTQLSQVLMNLCVNARDAMPEGGVLTVKAENANVDEHYAAMQPNAKAGPYVCVSVKDTGTGIPPDVLERIFDPFFTTKEPGTGTGLGLSTVQGIVKTHGGFIHVYSELRRGTEFKVWLPAQISAKPDPVDSRREAPRGQGELILLVDDEEIIRHVTSAALEAHGYRVARLRPIGRAAPNVENPTLFPGPAV